MRSEERAPTRTREGDFLGSTDAERLALATEASGLGIHEYDVRSGAIHWDSRVRELWGIGADEPVTYELFIAGVHPDDRAATQAAVDQALDPNGDGRYRAEYRVIHRVTKFERWVTATGQVFFEAQRPVRLIGTVQDVTDRRRGEEALRRSDALYRTMARNLPGGAVFLIDRNLRYVLAEGRGLDQVGLGPNHYEGRSVWEALDEETARHHASRIAHALRGESFRDEHTVRDRQFVTEGVPIFDDRGEVTHVLAMSYDVTELKDAEYALRESEGRFRIMADGLPLLVCVHDAAGRREFTNRSFRSYFGVSASTLSGDAWQVPVHSDDAARFSHTFRRCLEGHAKLQIDYRVVLPNGAVRWLESFGEPRFSASGHFHGLVIASLDITDRKEFEQRRDELLASEREARSEVERASRAKDDFLATLSHELRTPMSAVLGWAELLNRGLIPPDEVREAYEVIESNARLQKQLIDDMLEMGRVMSGKLRLDTRPLDVVAAVREVASAFRPEAQEKRIEIRFRGAGERYVLADRGRLGQIIGNLLSNAIKFTPPEGRVTIRVLQRAASRQVVIAVRDTGIGIPTEFLPHLFERFRQADPSTTRKFRGLGLGLALARQLTELHAGSIDARSDGQDRGATFIVRLPLMPLDPRGKPAHAPLLPSELRLDGVSVLLVDDEPATLGLVARVLREAGATIHLCDTAADAIALLSGASRAFDLLISDISMPGEDGYALVRRVQSLPVHRGVPAIALTAFSKAQARDRALAAGFQAFIVKPVETRELFATIAEVLQQKRVRKGIETGIGPVSSTSSSDGLARPGAV